MVFHVLRVIGSYVSDVNNCFLMNNYNLINDFMLSLKPQLLFRKYH